MAFTHAPAVPPQFFKDDGTVAAGYQLFVYQAGTSTKVTTYTDSAGSSANANPIILDSQGRCTIYLDNSVGAASVKFVMATDTDTDPPASPIWTRDNVAVIPENQVDLDISGTLGETVAAGDSVYLSVGLLSTTAGKWYMTDGSTGGPEASAASITGFAIDAGDADDSVTIRIGGRVTGLTGISAGSRYFASDTAGEIVTSGATSPRIVAVGDTTTSVVILQTPADAGSSVGGLISAAAQTIGGNKTFAGTVTFSSTSTISDAMTFSTPPIAAPTFSRCTSTLTKNTDTSLANVTGLAFSVGASEVWAFTFELDTESGATPDLKFALTGPAAPTALWYAVDLPLSAATATAFSTAIDAVGDSVRRQQRITGLLRNGANAGTVQLQFAQNTSDASDSKVYAESYVIAWRIS